MYRPFVNSVRHVRSWLRWRRPETDQTSESTTQSEQATSSSSSTMKSATEIAMMKKDDLLEYADSVRARGFLRTRYSYRPPADLERIVAEVVGVASVEDESWKQTSLNNPALKFKLLDTLGDRLSHRVPNSYLHEMRRVSDVIEFYARAVDNVTEYANLARQQRVTPKNVHAVEHAVRFHPEDTHLYHGGVTAFPGVGGEIRSLRHKRLRRQFNPKKEWHDYEEEHFDYSRPPKGAPWDPKVAEMMDRPSDTLHTDSKWKQ